MADLVECTFVSRQEALRRLEDLFTATFTTIGEASQVPSVQIPNYVSFDDDARVLVLSEDPTSKLTMKRHGFAVLFRVLAEVYILLKTNTKRTIRELYYNDKEFYKAQPTLSNALVQACRLLRVDRSSLNIVSTAKGLVCGDLSIRLDGDQYLSQEACSHKSNNLVPPMSGTLELTTSAAQCILVVEKDTVYNQLFQDGLLTRAPCIMVTGKGYPCLSTRYLVAQLRQQLDLPVYVLVDCDPHGIAIMLSYKHGTAASAHCNKALSCPSATWLGPTPHDLDRFQVPETAFLDMEAGDHAKLDSIFGTYPDLEEEDAIRELGARNYKAELESLNTPNFPTFLADRYVPTRLQEEGVLQPGQGVL
eukprot:TRINITY_DN11964_c0_g6_i1.p1 TRINITY_DN11964_c0_g6~~TRINITY_DN11964_c0_g6_i1.p1  ORF type:complete len:363 (+),score=53.07 TRINITY_DN11964_c0_g6_i1:519-1607(+)